ncbi:MAG: PD-(D/E)XK nuclease domain-containing protein, partial [Bacteroidales bacterium]|nr:PD-(D/E)XK nuclease domain-containing protein [Bacteroidales bacterium]
DTPTETLTDTTPLLYQSGYLTINGYDNVDGYLLDIPNNEVREGLMKSLLPEYVAPRAKNEGLRIGGKIGKLLDVGRIEEVLETVKSYLASISYPDNENYGEGHFHSMLYVIFGMSGLRIESQHRTSRGRIDLVIYAYDATYLIELKKDKTAAEALAQINEMGYADGFANTGLPPVVKIGININPDTRTINDWVIER